jgi:eukaryotic-like serine/threonine-protein kinase
MRHPRRTLMLSVAILAMGAGVIAFLATRTEEGPGRAATPRTPGLSAVQLSRGAAHDYDPEGDGEESPDQVRFAIDGNRPTEWDTEQYEGGFEASNKTGVGLYIDTGTPVAARQLDLVSSTPGFRAAVYASNSVPAEINGWKKLTQTLNVKQDQKFVLDTAQQKFRNYLLWISELPEGGQAVIRELSLKK